MRKGRNWWMIQAIINIIVVGLWLWGMVGFFMAVLWVVNLFLYPFFPEYGIPAPAYYPKWMMFGVSNLFFILMFSKPVKIFAGTWLIRIYKLTGGDIEEIEEEE